MISSSKINFNRVFSIENEEKHYNVVYIQTLLSMKKMQLIIVLISLRETNNWSLNHSKTDMTSRAKQILYKISRNYFVCDHCNLIVRKSKTTITIAKKSDEYNDWCFHELIRNYFKKTYIWIFEIKYYY